LQNEQHCVELFHSVTSDIVGTGIMLLLHTLVLASP